MSSGQSNSGVGDAIKKGVGIFHGTGEAIRGKFNATLDEADGDHAAAARNSAIASKGVGEIEHGYQPKGHHHAGHGAGVTPVDAERERLNTAQTTSTNYGSHTTNTANKLDPRFDSDLDHRGTATGSTVDHRADPNSCCAQISSSQTDGTDSPIAPFGSKWEPIGTLSHDHEHDEHCNCHASHIHRGSISGGTKLEAAQKLDPILGTEDVSTNNGPHSTNIANKLDPRIDSDANHRGDIATDKLASRDEVKVQHTATVNTPTRVSTFTRRTTEPSLPLESRSAPKSSSSDNLCLANSSRESTAPLDEPPSTTNPHKSGFLNLLDPRVNRGGVKQMRSSGS